MLLELSLQATLVTRLTSALAHIHIQTPDGIMNISSKTSDTDIILSIAFSCEQLDSNHAAQRQPPNYTSNYHSSYADHTCHKNVDSIII